VGRPRYLPQLSAALRGPGLYEGVGRCGWVAERRARVGMLSLHRFSAISGVIEIPAAQKSRRAPRLRSVRHYH
jgi:hypothetical protein